MNAINEIFLSDSSKNRLDDRTAAPFSADYFIRRVLVPEIASLLIADDLKIPVSDSKVRKTLESSREYGAALFPNEEELMDQPSAQRVCEKSRLSSPEDQLVLSQLPQIMVPFVNSIFNPAPLGNCGYLAIAGSVGDRSDDSYLQVRRKLLAELSTHAEDYARLISPPQTRTTVKTRKSVSFGTEVVQDLLFRLDYEDVECSQKYWLRMPYMGLIIASAYNRPIILLDPRKGCSSTFFPYRTLPNDSNEDPIVLAFVKRNHTVVNQDHFVSVEFKETRSMPFPEVFGMHRNAGVFDTTTIPAWSVQYQDQLARWVQ